MINADIVLLNTLFLRGKNILSILVKLVYYKIYFLHLLKNLTIFNLLLHYANHPFFCSNVRL